MENWFAGEKCGFYHKYIILEIILKKFLITSFTDFIQQIIIKKKLKKE